MPATHRVDVQPTIHAIRSLPVQQGAGTPASSATRRPQPTRRRVVVVQQSQVDPTCCGRSRRGKIKRKVKVIAASPGAAKPVLGSSDVDRVQHRVAGQGPTSGRSSPGDRCYCFRKLAAIAVLGAVIIISCMAIVTVVSDDQAFVKPDARILSESKSTTQATETTQGTQAGNATTPQSSTNQPVAPDEAGEVVTPGMDRSYTTWSVWSYCSAAGCGTGIQQRHRSCSGKNCKKKKQTSIKQCYNGPCECTFWIATNDGIFNIDDRGRAISDRPVADIPRGITYDPFKKNVFYITMTEAWKFSEGDDPRSFFRSESLGEITTFTNDVIRHYLFFCILEYGYVRTDYDGKRQIRVKKYFIQHAIALVTWSDQRVLFWVERNTNALLRCKYDGSEYQTVYAGGNGVPAIGNGQMYGLVLVQQEVVYPVLYWLQTEAQDGVNGTQDSYLRIYEGSPWGDSPFLLYEMSQDAPEPDTANDTTWAYQPGSGLAFCNHYFYFALKGGEEDNSDIYRVIKEGTVDTRFGKGSYNLITGIVPDN